MAEGGDRDCETQKNEIGTLLKTPLKKGETWYLVDTKWFKQWKKFVGYDNWDTAYVGDESANPGPIDNSPLFKDDPENEGTLKENLMDELDYMLVPVEAWSKLLEWYGNTEGQQPIVRKVIEQGMFVKHCKVEVYMMDLKLCENSDLESIITQQFSRADTIDFIEKEMRRVFNISEEKEVRLWNKYMSNTFEPLNKPENTVQDTCLYQGQVIVIEQKNEDGTWPRPSKSSNYTSTTGTNNSGSSSGLEIGPYSSSSGRSSGTYSYSGSYGSSYYNSHNDSYRSSASPGQCGLSNLGNTCFMNSALQCMSNVPSLTDYFLHDDWKAELNQDNPLGMKGEIATSYAELIRHIWSGKYSYTVPRNFKIAVGRFAPQFSGFQQQDSQELMAFLLDGLHEDLNRIKKKPYVELKDTDGRSDTEVAREAWENYLKRNDSVIVDTFHGLLKSTLVCPECEKVSVTFDPFCYLSLPLPLKKERQIELFLVPMDPAKKPRQYKVTVPKMGAVLDLCKALHKLTTIATDKMVVADVYNHRFHKVYTMEDSLSQILDRDDIFVYEVSVSSGDDPDTLMLPVYLRELKIRQTSNSYQHTTTQLFGQPLLVPVPRKTCTHDVLQNCILERMGRYVHRPKPNQEWWKNAKKSPVKKEEQKEVNGEVDMNNEESEGHDEVDKKQNESNAGGASGSTAEEEDEGEDDLDEETEASDKKKPPNMFTFNMVNSYGSSEVDHIKADGKPIKFSNRSYVALDWHPRAKAQFYDEKAAEDFEQDNSVHYKPMQKKHVIQLTECLELFTTTEKLGEQDPWYCPQCKKHQQATKKFDLWQLPQILVIHLKRFSYNRYWRDKIDAFVEYPTKGLNMRKYIINPQPVPSNYDLIAVSNHYGGMGGGHYTAYGKNKDDGSWYYFDDSSVSQSSEDAVTTKAGYVLVYQRRDPESVERASHAATAVPSAAAAAGSPERDMVVVSNGDCSNDEEMDVN